MSKRTLLSLALASWGAFALPDEALAQTRQAPVTDDPRASLGILVGVSSVHGGQYETTASQWGYGTFGGALTLAVEGGAWVTPWLSLGGRLGMLRASSDATPTDGARLALASYDLGAYARLGGVLGHRRVRGFLGVQLEGGVQWASIDLRSESTSEATARFAVMGVGQVIVGPVAFGLRVGPRFGSWAGAGGAGADLDLGGIEFSTGVEVRP